MKQRVITGICLAILLVLVVILINTPFFTLVICLLSSIATHEIINCAGVKNKFIKLVGVATSFVIPIVSSAKTLEPIVSEEKLSIIINFAPKSIFVVLIIISFFLAMLKDYKNTKFQGVAISLVATFVTPMAFSIFCLLRDDSYFTSNKGVYFIFYGLIAALITDIGAQLGGMKFGKHKMSPNISPKKTVEGAISGVIFSTLMNFVAMMIFNAVTPDSDNLLTKEIIILLIAAPFISFLSMMGDLTASVLKRNFEIKDFGKIFPGHGGVMDRFDSSLFTLPLTYVVVQIIKLF